MNHENTSRMPRLYREILTIHSRQCCNVSRTLSVASMLAPFSKRKAKQSSRLHAAATISAEAPVWVSHENCAEKKTTKWWKIILNEKKWEQSGRDSNYTQTASRKHDCSKRLESAQSRQLQKDECWKRNKTKTSHSSFELPTLASVRLWESLDKMKHVAAANFRQPR